MRYPERSPLSAATDSPKRKFVGAVFVAASLATCGLIFADYWSAEPADAVASFVGRDSCISCHQEETDSFIGSHHDKAMDLATDETVLGDFDNATIEHDGLTNRMFRDGDRFMVHTEGPTGKMEDFHVKYVFGVEPLQQYMVEFDRTPDMKDSEIARLQVLRISWDTENKRWFYLRPPDVDDKLEPDDPLHWTGIAQRWQTMCADCHSTNLKRNFSTKTQRYHTTFSEMDVSCEACHGPGSMHIQLANANSLFWDRNHGYGLAKLKGDDPQPQLQTCAPCHSRRGVIDPNFKGGDYYHDHYSLELLRPDTYHVDGQIKDEVYVFGSFAQSKMYHKDIRCTDCHDPHSLKLKKTGNETCTSCHQHPAAKYDVPSHHHHEPGTAGASCVNCHMPHTTYMAVDKRRDHSLRIPRPDLSVELRGASDLGPPNACSSCHVKDKLKTLPGDVQTQLADAKYQDWFELAAKDSAIAEALRATDKWCDDACEKWYGAERKKPEHFARILHGLREKNDAAATEQAVRALAKPSELMPALAKATILSEITAEHDTLALADIAKQFAENGSEEPIVRAAAINAFLQANSVLGVKTGMDPAQAIRELLPLLADESRQVRTEAARVLVNSGAYARTLSEAERTTVDLALKELKASLMSASDRAGAHLGWALLCEERGMNAEAVASYETAIKTEPLVTGARTNLARLLERLAERTNPQRAKEIEGYVKTLRSEELPLLKRDAKLAPNNANIQYRLGLAMYLAGEYLPAKAQLEKAIELAPEIPDFQQALRLLNQKLEAEK